MSTTTSIVITTSSPPPKAGVHAYPARGPIAYVDLDDFAVRITATDPAHLLLIAEAFTDAARQLSAQLDLEAARAMNAEQVPA